MIAIVDYGLGNVLNVKRAIEYLDYDVILSRDLDVLSKADTLILPGVGHFKDAMQTIKSYHLDHYLKVTSQPIIGICLGMQLLYERSAEGEVEGLGLLPGQIFPINTSYTVPHLGWNTLQSPSEALNHDVYFVHSYQAPMDENVIAYASYGTDIPAIVQHQQYTGIQFHPEKSGNNGLIILKTALEGGFSNVKTMASH
ncbi:imidazole glycerol phosphate synthase subunit HisH [Staphylococcus felis]|uniref:imidazole glycerol phosphate synthase subunit HisH n=1 Tax=Staphylococcus felis TaxID=46127 RepID=UPI000E246781|nr:imidazole glycerol phosphate synthase subunit HisH [Staphylococcus felis]REH95211.1 imidazole glycerol phosphate synthase subunit HisH [Staphylococcus felis]